MFRIGFYDFESQGAGINVKEFSTIKELQEDERIKSFVEKEYRDRKFFRFRILQLGIRMNLIADYGTDEDNLKCCIVGAIDDKESYDILKTAFPE